MISIVRTFGAPVTEPLGNNPRNTPATPTSASSSADTVVVSCQTVSYRSAWKTSAQVTEPVRLIRPRSFRRRSTIIAFSARSFAEARSRSATARSSSGHRPRGAVPFIGLVTIAPSRSSKKSSGEAESTR